MAAANLNLPHFPIFDTTEVDTLPQRYKTYKKRFEILVNTIGVNNERQKLSMLLCFLHTFAKRCMRYTNRSSSKIQIY